MIKHDDEAKLSTCVEPKLVSLGFHVHHFRSYFARNLWAYIGSFKKM